MFHLSHTYKLAVQYKASFQKGKTGVEKRVLGGKKGGEEERERKKEREKTQKHDFDSLVLCKSYSEGR